MEFVEPIRDIKHINSIKRYLKDKKGNHNLRDWLLFTLGVNSGLRISDLLRLTIEDVSGKDRIIIKEDKTGKSKNFPLADNCKKAIAEYLKKSGLTTGALFPSRQSNGAGKVTGTGAISRQQAYSIINDAARECNVITDANGTKIGTHTLRKTFGYHAYKAGVSIEVIQKLLNHSAPSVTLRYLGITQDELDDVYINLNL